jgi:hypothetical protein
MLQYVPCQKWDFNQIVLRGMPHYESGADANQLAYREWASGTGWLLTERLTLVLNHTGGTQHEPIMSSCPCELKSS